jgi:DNA polymerase-3 subunit gamma/tau
MVAAQPHNHQFEPAMNYQVLARKWRPHNFTEVVGQEHVVKSLMNALQHDRLHHAYLFTGTRGVGKTTIARILAKAINCQNLQDFNPCGQCSVCRDLDEGRFLDLIEVDAASRTKVEDTRDLLDNVQYAPNQGRYKVYLIDEVHMLSGHSFNALLKTLEEPPPHVKFLLATTDPHKIPITVLSRCLQFNLKRLLPDEIFKQMEFILQQERIEFEIAALKLLARAADGSMRDGLSLLDQAIVFGNGKVKTEQVIAMLGTVAQQPVDDLLTALADSDAEAILNKINEIANLTPDFGDVLQQILQVLHRVALIQQVPGAVNHDFDAEMIAALASRLTPEDVQLYYQIGLIGQRDLDLAPDPRSGFEMVMLRMLTFRPVAQEQSLAKPVQVSRAVAKPEVVKASQMTTSALNKPEPVQEPAIDRTDNDWAGMVVAMKIGGMTRELANNCVLDSIDDKVCTLILDPGHKHLRSAVTEEKLQSALQRYRGTSLKLVINTEKVAVDTPAVQLIKEREDRQQAAVDAINSDENIQALKEHFDARVLPGSIEPV